MKTTNIWFQLTNKKLFAVEIFHNSGRVKAFLTIAFSILVPMVNLFKLIIKYVKKLGVGYFRT